jgi:hypothetical protein
MANSADYDQAELGLHKPHGQIQFTTSMLRINALIAASNRIKNIGETNKRPKIHFYKT